MATSTNENEENIAVKEGGGVVTPTPTPCAFLQRYKIISCATLQRHVLSPTAVFAVDTTNNNLQVFIKFAMEGEAHRTVRREATTLTDLMAKNPRYTTFLSNCNIGLPALVEYDTSDRCHYMVTTKAGTSLEILHEQPDVAFSTTDLAKLGIRLLEIIEYVHDTGYIHGDIHPGNVVLSGDLQTETYRVVLIDFKRSMKYLMKGDHIAEVAKPDLDHMNSYKSFCSANQQCMNLSRKHDLEMIGIMLVEMKETCLPYHTSVRLGKRKDKRHRIKKYRFPKSKSLKETYEKLQPPEVFLDFIQYSRSLPFGDRPDYAIWKQNFQQLLD